MKRLALVLVLVLAAIPAFADQPAPLEQRIGAQIGALVIQNTSLQMQLEQAQATLRIVQDQLKALQDKYEPKDQGQAKPK